jgi:hypothetical protein
MGGGDLHLVQPWPVQLVNGNCDNRVLKLLKNLYGQKGLEPVLEEGAVEYWFCSIQGGRVCLLHRGNAIFTVYIDDEISAGPVPAEIE